MSLARVARLAGAAATLVLLAGCGDKASTATDTSDGTSPGSSTSPGTAGAGACPTGGAAASWPDTVPADIPLPGGSQVQTTSESQGVSYVRFLVPLSFTDAVKLYLDQLPAAGYVLGTGDSESSEADIPFTKDPGQYSLKLSGLSDPCHTQGVLGVGGTGDPDEDGDDPDATDSDDPDAG